jgi:hypothetical protein
MANDLMNHCVSFYSNSCCSKSEGEGEGGSRASVCKWSVHCHRQRTDVTQLGMMLLLQSKKLIGTSEEQKQKLQCRWGVREVQHSRRLSLSIDVVMHKLHEHGGVPKGFLV